MTRDRSALPAVLAAAAVLVAVVVLVVVLAGGGGGGNGPRRLGTVLRGYVDCSRSSSGDGSVSRPWNSLAAADNVVVQPGGSLSLRRGTVCRGTLAPHGSGRAGAPIIIGSYGSGPPARIDASGRAPDAVRLAGEAHVIVQDLEVVNRGDYSRPRRGVHVVGSLSAPGAVHDIVIRRLYVHDIDGNDVKGLGGSGGIQVDAARRNVVVEDNRIEDVNRSGIWIVGTGLPPRPPASRPWPSATTGVIVRRNSVRRMGGDGIVPTATLGAVVDDNIVCCGNLRGRPGVQFDAGIWTFLANRTVIEHNVVYGMLNARADGTGYDVDYNQDGTIVQSNYSEGNAGGFIVLCTDAMSRHADVRFNLSVNEYALSPGRCTQAGQPPGTLAGLRVYNNTFLTPSSQVWLSDTALASYLPRPADFEFANNIVYGTRRNFRPFPCGNRCTHNLFWNMPRSGRNALLADPRFIRQTDPGPPRLALASAFRLRSDSPALRAGQPVGAGGARDYFGVPVADPPALGFAQP